MAWLVGSMPFQHEPGCLAFAVASLANRMPALLIGSQQAIACTNPFNDTSLVYRVEALPWGSLSDFLPALLQ